MDFKQNNFGGFGTMKKILFIFLLLIVIVQVAFSQQEKENENSSRSRKNAIYGSLGIPIGYLLLNYERQLIWLDKDKIAIDMRLSYGAYANLGEDGNAAIICSEIIFGENKHHFEADLGLALNRNQESQAKPMPANLPCINICYRIQQKNKPFLFKTGIGFPEGVFVCIGLAF
jgi:hypothetical protein